MNVFESLNDFKPLKKTVVTSGTFDGVHLGHKKILQKLNSIARGINGESVLITYWPHPRLVLDPKNHSIKLLSTFEEKVKLLENAGLDHVVKVPFTPTFAQMSSREFVDKVLVKALGTDTLVIGYNHRFGHNREGSFQSLKKDSDKYGFRIMEIPKQEVDSMVISSTKIRQSLGAGKIHVSNQLLGYEYELTGKVVPGDQRGRTLGFPTANIEPNSSMKLIPADGSYAVRVFIGKNYHEGMLNIGVRPTLEGQSHTIEAHIFGVEKDLYGQQLTIRFVKFIRKESQFSDLEALRNQLIKDKQTAQDILGLSKAQ